MFESITPETIKQNIFDALEASGVEVETREGSYADALIGPAALEIWKVYAGLDAMLPIVYPTEASGEYLDIRCAYYGITRKAGTAAKVTLTVSGRDGVQVPKGSAFLTVAGVRFLTDAAAVLSDGSAQIAATAAEAGITGNVAAGEITRQLTSISGVTAVTNEAEASGGTDPETDAALLGRLLTRLREAATSGNASHYRQWTLETDGVGAAKVVPLWNGAGTVKVLIASAGIGPVGSAVTAACAAHIESVRPIGAAVTVQSVSATAINVSAAVSVSASTTVGAVQAAFESALAEYLQSISFEQYTVPYTRIGYLLAGIDGVLDYSGLTANGGTANITIAADCVPQVGTVSINAD